MLSLIIPTMWMYGPFVRHLEVLVKNPIIGEIIIIDNNSEVEQPDRPILNHHKITVVEMPKNIYVNAAWNLGVALAKHVKVCVMNDDVIVDGEVFDRADRYLNTRNVGVVGICPGDPAFNQRPFKDGLIDIIPWVDPEPGQEHGSRFGFGTLFFLKREDWVPIPASLEILFGDDWVFETQKLLGHQNALITNAFYYTPSAVTCTEVFKDLDYDSTYSKEQTAYVAELEYFIRSAPKAYLVDQFFKSSKAITDINEHLPTLKMYADQCDSVVELGVRDGQSTRAFLASSAKSVKSYDIVVNDFVAGLFEVARLSGMDAVYYHADVLQEDLPEADLYFIDTDHTYNQLSQELALHGNKARKYIILHDTTTYSDALEPAIIEFLSKNQHWDFAAVYENNNGLTVLERV